MPVPILLIAAAAAAAAKGISGAVQAKKAKSEAEKLANSRPMLPNNQFSQDQLAFTENELDRNEAMDEFNHGIDRDLSNSIGAILKGGGDINNVGQLFDSSQQGRQRARLMSENMRMNNIQNYIRASQNADTSNQQQFQFNQVAPWMDRAQANAQSRLAANQKIWGAVDELGSVGMRYGAGQMGNAGTNGGGWDTPQIESYTTPNHVGYDGSVSSQFNTIDPNKLTNWSINQ